MRQEGYNLELVDKMRKFHSCADVYLDRKWRVVKRFAWLPIRIFISTENEYSIWLKPYYEFYELSDQYGWVPFTTLEPKHLC